MIDKRSCKSSLTSCAVSFLFCVWTGNDLATFVVSDVDDNNGSDFMTDSEMDWKALSRIDFLMDSSP